MGSTRRLAPYGPVRTRSLSVSGAEHRRIRIAAPTCGQNDTPGSRYQSQKQRFVQHSPHDAEAPGTEPDPYRPLVLSRSPARPSSRPPMLTQPAARRRHGKITG